MIIAYYSTGISERLEIKLVFNCYHLIDDVFLSSVHEFNSKKFFRTILLHFEANNNPIFNCKWRMSHWGILTSIS